MRDLTHSRHTITGMAFSPDGRWLAVGRVGANVLLWNRATAKPPRGIAGLYDVPNLRFIRDGRLVACKSSGSVHLADPDTANLTGHIALPASLSLPDFAPDGSRLVLCVRSWHRPGDFTCVLACRTMDGRECWRSDFPWPMKPIFTADSRFVLAASTHVLLRLDAETGSVVSRCLVRLEEFATRLLAVSSDGRLAVTPGAPPVLDTAAGTLTLPCDGLVTAAAFSPDGRTLATVGPEGLVRFWDTEERRETAAFDLEFGRQRVTALAFAPDGLTLAAGGVAGRLVLIDMA